MSFELEETGDLANDDVLRQKAEPGAKLEIVGGRNERFEREPADDVRELVRPPNTGGQVLPLHRLSHDHKASGDPGGVTLRRTKQRVGERLLKAAE